MSLPALQVQDAIAALDCAIRSLESAARSLELADIDPDLKTLPKGQMDAGRSAALYARGIARDALLNLSVRSAAAG